MQYDHLNLWCHKTATYVQIRGDGQDNMWYWIEQNWSREMRNQCEGQHFLWIQVKINRQDTTLKKIART